LIAGVRRDTIRRPAESKTRTVTSPARSVQVTRSRPSAERAVHVVRTERELGGQTTPRGSLFGFCLAIFGVAPEVSGFRLAGVFVGEPDCAPTFFLAFFRVFSEGDAAEHLGQRRFHAAKGTKGFPHASHALC
jgi:hypothetical protein